MAARRRLKDIEGQRARLARKVVASAAVVVRAAAAQEQDNGPECQPNADAPLLRDEGARRKWVDEELFRCCEVSSQGSGCIHFDARFHPKHGILNPMLCGCFQSGRQLQWVGCQSQPLLWVPLPPR